MTLSQLLTISLLTTCLAPGESWLRHGRSRARLSRQMKRSDDYYEPLTTPDGEPYPSSREHEETPSTTSSSPPVSLASPASPASPANPAPPPTLTIPAGGPGPAPQSSDIVTKFLRIVESQQQLGENCTAGTALNLGEGVVDRYAQEKFRVEAELAVNRANMLTRLWKYASPDVLHSEYLLHASVLSMVEFDEDIFAAGNCYDKFQYKNFMLYCPYAYRLPEGEILVKDLAVEYKYLSNTSEWFYIARKNAEKVIKNFNQISKGKELVKSLLEPTTRRCKLKLILSV